jgi:hypothetical protein
MRTEYGQGEDWTLSSRSGRHVMSSPYDHNGKPSPPIHFSINRNLTDSKGLEGSATLSRLEGLLLAPPEATPREIRVGLKFINHCLHLGMIAPVKY